MGCVLVVEDDLDIRESVSELLRGEGYEVFEAENGQHALNVLAQLGQPPCVVLLDLMMPVMSGSEFLAALEATGTHVSVPVVVISAFADRQAVPKAKVVLQKPTKPNVLLGVVREYCSST